MKHAYSLGSKCHNEDEVKNVGEVIIHILLHVVNKFYDQQKL